MKITFGNNLKSVDFFWKKSWKGQFSPIFEQFPQIICIMPGALNNSRTGLLSWNGLQQFQYSLFPTFSTFFGSAFPNRKSCQALLYSPFLTLFRVSNSSEFFSITEWGANPLIQRKTIIWRLVSMEQVFWTSYWMLESGGLYLYDHWITDCLSEATVVISLWTR